MPNTWDPKVYRQRGHAWREKAAALPEDNPERDICVQIAAGYEALADHLEAQPGGQVTAGLDQQVNSCPKADIA